MALKKSELYTSLWRSCNELRGGMDAGQYKDYVLALLFIKCISDKYAGQTNGPVVIPEGAGFRDLAALKGRSDIGEQINQSIIAPIQRENQLPYLPDFNDTAKLGGGKEMVDRLSRLIGIFEALDFSRNNAQGDDILGDAYEYLMGHFAVESSKSKGQFYTPPEVSRVMAQLLGLRGAPSSLGPSVYDPTCGSGSLLLKVSAEAGGSAALFGQERDAATCALARMNMILHQNAGARIEQGNTLSDPKFKDGTALQSFDYVVANPPFSDKRWSTGLDPMNDPFGRFLPYGIPPAKQGDYAYLLHLIASLKGTGRGVCIMPLGVLFRGNAEAGIRRALLEQGLVEGIIGLPPNLFYGTSIPACLVIIDKQNAKTRKDIMMIDAQLGFRKDGIKNRLRARDMHQMVDVYTRRLDVPGYGRRVSLLEIERSGHNLNIARYIESRPSEDLEDIGGHLHGGIPISDIGGLGAYFQVCPGLWGRLFKERRPGYVELAMDSAELSAAVEEDTELLAWKAAMRARLAAWREWSAKILMALERGRVPKDIVERVSEELLDCFRGQPLLDAYAIYQHWMDMGAAVLGDDLDRVEVEGWSRELLPKDLVAAHFFERERAEAEALEAELLGVREAMRALEEEHEGEDGVFSELGKPSKAKVAARLRELGEDEEAEVLGAWISLHERGEVLKKRLKEAEGALDGKVKERWGKLGEDDTKKRVVERKWLGGMEAALEGELSRVSRALSGRLMDLADRYGEPLGVMQARVLELEGKVRGHLVGAMGVESTS